MTNTTKVGNTDFRAKWNYNLEYMRFTQVPNVLLECQGHLKLKDGELLTLIHLISYWFGDKSKIYPSINTLKKFSGKSYPTIQKRLKNLEDKGFLKRIHQFGTSNQYDLTPSVQRLEEHLEVCSKAHRKQDEYYLINYQGPTSETIKKEYEANNWNLDKTVNVKATRQKSTFSSTRYTPF